MADQRRRGLKPKRTAVSLNVLPGEPTDGSGRVCIHLFVRDESGPFTESHVLQPARDSAGNIVRGKGGAGPARGRLACDPKRVVAIRTSGGVSTVTPRTDDPRAVSCLKCVASTDYERAMKLLEA